MARAVSFVIPTLNEEQALPTVLASIPRDELAKLGYDVEVLIVDGASTDGTREIAEAGGARVIVEQRRGYGRAYKTGFAQAKGELIVTGDADGTYPFERVPELLQRLDAENLDFLTTNRLAGAEPGALSAKHRFGNAVLSTACRVLFWVPFRDSQSGMWVFRRGVLDHLVLTSDGMPFSEEIKLEAFRNGSVRAAEVVVPYRVRQGEVKLDSWRDGWRNLMFLVRKRFGLTGGD